MRWMSDFAPSLGRAGTHPGREPTGPPDAPSGPDGVGQAGAVGEQVAGGDLAGPPPPPTAPVAARERARRWGIQVEHAAFGQPHRGRRSHDLRHRKPRAHHAGQGRNPGSNVSKPGRLAARTPSGPAPAPRRPAHPRLPAPGSARRRSRLPASAPPSAHSGVTRRVRPGQAPGRRRTCLLLRRAC